MKGTEKFKSISKYVARYVSALLFVTAASQTYALKVMSDDELKASTGQALLNMSYLAPNAAGNFESDKGFYKVGLDAQLELNANIKKLQLGCDGVNGSGCDIDIDNLSLSGAPPALDSAGSPDFSSLARPETDAVLTNPFIQLAFKNPQSLVNREFLGFQVGAEAMSGLLSLGDQAKSTGLTPAEAAAANNGLNVFSGYMHIAGTTGTATTNPRTFTRADTGVDLNFRICCVFFIPLNGSSNNYTITSGTGSANVNYNPINVEGTRLTSAQVTGTGIVDSIPLSGNMAAQVSVLNLDTSLSGNLRNLGINVNVTESLGFIHNLNLADNPTTLSLQSENIIWPNAPRRDGGTGARVAAQQGWWLASSGSVDLGELVPSNNIDIPDATLIEVLNLTSQVLTDNPVDCGAGGFFPVDCLGGSTNIGDLDLSSSPNVNFSISDLALQNQRVTPNCYAGSGLRFC